MDKQQMPMQVQHDMTNLHQDDIWQRVQRLEQELRDREGKILLLQDELAKTKDQNEELEKRVKELTSKGSNKKGAQSRYWRKDEHERFLEAIQKFGKKDVKNIAGYVATRSATQVRTHAQKWFLKQKRESERKMQQRERVLMEREERMQREWQRVQAMRPTSNNGGNNTSSTPLPRPGSFSSPSPLPFPNMDPGFLTAEESRNLLNAMKAYESEKDYVTKLQLVQKNALPHRTVEEINMMVNLLHEYSSNQGPNKKGRSPFGFVYNNYYPFAGVGEVPRPGSVEAGLNRPIKTEPATLPPIEQALLIQLQGGHPMPPQMHGPPHTWGLSAGTPTSPPPSWGMDLSMYSDHMNKNSGNHQNGNSGNNNSNNKNPNNANDDDDDDEELKALRNKQQKVLPTGMTPTMTPGGLPLAQLGMGPLGLQTPLGLSMSPGLMMGTFSPTQGLVMCPSPLRFPTPTFFGGSQTPNVEQKQKS
jgi:SHAQKYF class myb-like DNA-binding protein